MSVSAELLRTRSIAAEAAIAGGRAAARHFRRAGLHVESKADDSPVTIADRESEAACQALIATAFPNDAWLGEESGERGALVVGGRRWIVDPIDGTRNFVRGIPLWTTLVACEEATADGTRIIAAAVYAPALDEIYDAVRGGGARCNGEAIHVSTIADLGHALFCYETPSWFQRYGLSSLFERLCADTALQRGGGDAYWHMLVASGRAEVVVEPSLSVWDVAATSLVVEEAGGRFSDLDGTHDLRSGSAVISNGSLHQPVLDLIRRLRS